MTDHVLLYIADAEAGARQAVEVERLGDEKLRVLASPGFVEGVAAGDVIRIVDEVLGTFVVVGRGGNLAVKVVSDEPIGPVIERAAREVAEVGGRLDGSRERSAVFTVPASAGFVRIEAIFNGLSSSFRGVVWWFGNAYDDGGKPLNWWVSDKR